MGRRLRAGLLVGVAVSAFVTAYALSSWRTQQGVPAKVSSQGNDREILARQGIVSGRQLIAFVFVSSRCGYCQRPDTKTALAVLGDSLKKASASQFSHSSVIGVAVNTDFEEGLGYLESVGLENFDEISVGRGWLNEHVRQFLWQDTAASPSVPQIVLIARSPRCSTDARYDSNNWHGFAGWSFCGIG